MDASRERSGLEAWTQFLADKPLPVKSLTIQKIRSALENPNVSLQQLAPIIATDPALTLHLIQKANELNQNSETDASSVELAVSMLGMDHLLQLFDSVPIIKLNPNSSPHRWYFRSLDNSVHAGFQAADFCIFPNANVIADTKLAATFYAIGHWALWRYAPIEMAEIKDAVFRLGLLHSDAEKQVLGCSIKDLSAQLVSLWNLSKLAKEALQHEITLSEQTLTSLQVFTTAPDSLSESEQKTMRHLINHQFYPVRLANWLIGAVEVDWNSDISHLLHQCIADQLKTDIDSGRKRIIDNAVAASRFNHTPGVFSPAEYLLLIPSDLHLPYEQPKNRTKPSQTKAATPKAPAEAKLESPAKTETKTKQVNSSGVHDYLQQDTFKNKTLFQQSCQKLLDAENGCSSSTEVYKTLAHGLKEALGYQRVALFTVREDNTVVASMFSGIGKQDKLRRFTQKITVPGLMNKLSKKPGAILMNAENRLQVKMQMSDRFKSCSHQASLSLMSIHHKGRPVLYVYVDHGELPLDVSPFYFKYFKAICNAAGKRLNQLADAR